MTIGPPPVQPRPAGTVAVLRDGPDGLEVLLTRRPATMAFAPDVHAFPGGAVDAMDGELPSAAVAPAPSGVPVASAVAAVRELFEEAGILLAEPAADRALLETARHALLRGEGTIGEVVTELGVVLRLDRLVPLSHWVTPPTYPKRFETWFFAALLRTGEDATLVGDEVTSHRWLTPRAALDAMAAGDLAMWAPTSVTLQQLEHVRAFEEIAERLTPRLPGPIVVQAVTPGVKRVALPAAGGVPGQTVNAYLVGERERVLVDPGDPTPAAAEALLAEAGAGGGTIRAIVLTHVDPDHGAGTAGLIERLRVPVYRGPGGERGLSHESHELSSGSLVPAGDVPLVAMATPGHRADHLALLMDDHGIVLSGDLVGEQASRSIPGPADAAAWRASLDLVEDQAPRLLLPGHGEPIRSVAAAITRERERLAEKWPSGP